MKSSSPPIARMANHPGTMRAQPVERRSLLEHSFVRYELAILAVAISVGLKFIFETFNSPFPFTSFSIVAIAIIVWYCGIGPGVLAVGLSSLAIAYLVPAPIVSNSRIPYVINHVVPALLVFWISAARLRADRLLRQARDELELKVEARTAEVRQVNEELRAEITERKSAEAALRASEQVARGQVEALAQNLDILATAPAPENLIGQMLSTIGRFLDAQSVVFLLLDEAHDTLVLRAAAEGANFAAADLEHPLIKDPGSWKIDRWIQEMFFTGAPAAVEEIDSDPRVSSDIRDYFRSKGTRKFLGIPTLMGGEVKGFIGIRHGDRPAYRPEEIELAQALAHQAMFAVQLDQFAEQGQEAAVLEERNRMARDIHDPLAQGFTGVIIQLEAAEDAMSCGHEKEADKHLHRAAGLARQSLTEARRSVHALRPDVLERNNVWQALKGIIKNTTAGTALHTTCELRGKLPELPPIWQENLLHIGQEALTNTLRYADAKNFRARLNCNVEGVRLELRDDGAGFGLNDRNDGLGLTGMRERVEQMDGDLQITTAPGQGTNVVVVLPVPDEKTKLALLSGSR